jgi:hypothetical protein
LAPFQQLYGGVFQSGANAATYAPFNNPEQDDPYPVKSRGLFFNGTSYLTTSIFYLNYEFSIAF